MVVPGAPLSLLVVRSVDRHLGFLYLATATVTLPVARHRLAVAASSCRLRIPPRRVSRRLISLLNGDLNVLCHADLHVLRVRVGIELHHAV